MGNYNSLYLPMMVLGCALTGEKMKTIQAVNAARKEAVAKGMSLEQAMESITDETVGKK